MSDSPVLDEMREFFERWGPLDRDLALCVAFDIFKGPDLDARKYLFRELVTVFVDRSADVRHVAGMLADDLLEEMIGESDMADAIEALRGELGLAVLGEERGKVRSIFTRVIKRLESDPQHLLAYAA